MKQKVWCFPDPTLPPGETRGLSKSHRKQQWVRGPSPHLSTVYIHLI